MQSLNFFEMSQDIMCILNFDGYILNANPAWKTVLGWVPEEVVNTHFTTYIHPEHLQNVIDKAKEANIKGGTKYVEFKALHKNGEFRWISWSSKVDFEKKIKLGIARDITIQKIATEKLSNTVQRLKEKEKFLEMTLGALPSLISYINLDYTYAYVNPAYEKWFGIKKEDCIGKTIADIIGEDAFNIGKVYVDGARSGVEQNFEISVPYKNNIKRSVQVRYIPNINENKVDGFFAIVHDISNLKNAEKTALQKEKEITQLFNSLTEGVLLQDRFGNIVKHNQSFFDIVGIKTHDTMKNKNDLLKFTPLDENLENLKTENFPSTRALKTGQIQKNVVLALKRESGDLSWLSATAVPLNLNHDAEFDHVLITFNDITEQKNIEKERTENRAKLVASAKMSSLGEMAGGIAHEINNPLSIIYGKSGQLIRKIQNGLSDPALLIQDISKIESMADRIAKIIKGLHAFTRNSESEPMIENSLIQIINETFDLCSERFKNRSTDLSFFCDTDIYLECKSTQISQVLMNLLNNSLDAVEHLNEKWVKLSAKCISDTIQISVTDSGKGISKNTLEKMMQPFFTTKELGKGTGLGLSISKGLIESHHGKFYYDETSSNTCFKIELPKKQQKQEKKSA